MPIKTDCGLEIVPKQELRQGLWSQSAARICRYRGQCSLKRSIGKGTGRPPHLVTTDDVLRRESRPAEGSALDPELSHPVAKGVGMEIEDSRRPFRPINHPIRLPKGDQNMASFHFFQGGQFGR
jgi:hypothetical protein